MTAAPEVSPRRTSTGFSLLPEHHELLGRIAEQIADGNRSRALEKLLDIHAGRILADGSSVESETRTHARFASRRLSGSLIDEVAASVRAGNTRKNAYHLAGVTEKQAREWLARGRADQHKGAQSLYADLVLALDQADAEFAQLGVEGMKAKGQWRELLRAKFEDFVEVRRSEATITQHLQPLIVWEQLDIPETRMLIALLRKASPQGDEQGISKSARPVAELLPGDVIDDAEWTEAPPLEAPALDEKPGG